MTELTDEQKAQAEKMGVNLTPETTPEDDKGKAEDESSDSEGSEVTPEDKPEGETKVEPVKKDETDYKKAYSESTKEVQQKYIPMEKAHNALIGFIDANPDVQEAIERALEKKNGNIPEDNDENPDPVVDKVNIMEKKVNELTEKEKQKSIEETDEAINDFYKWLNDAGQAAMTESEWQEFSDDAMTHIRKHAKKLPYKQAVIQSLKDEYYLQHPDVIRKEGRKELLIEQKKNEGTAIPGGSGSKGSESKSGLSESQKAWAKKMGLDPDKINNEF